nr:MAG TPA: hypothetical protein [Caudoviricetes sp.]
MNHKINLNCGLHKMKKRNRKCLPTRDVNLLMSDQSVSFGGSGLL